MRIHAIHNSQVSLDHRMGYGRTHTYDLRIEPASGSKVKLVTPDGAYLYFTSAGGGAYTSPPGVTAQLSSSAANVYDLVAAADDPILRRKSNDQRRDWTYHFVPLLWETNTAT